MLEHEKRLVKYLMRYWHSGNYVFNRVMVLSTKNVEPTSISDIINWLKGLDEYKTFHDKRNCDCHEYYDGRYYEVVEDPFESIEE